MRDKNLTTRRAFLKGMGLLGIAAPLISTTGCGGSDKDDGKVEAFKLSARGRNACNACKAHARNKIFQTSIIAGAHRAHAGCKCRIKVVRIPDADAKKYFAQFPYYDRRSTV